MRKLFLPLAAALFVATPQVSSAAPPANLAGFQAASVLAEHATYYRRDYDYDDYYSRRRYYGGYYPRYRYYRHYDYDYYPRRSYYRPYYYRSYPNYYYRRYWY